MWSPEHADVRVVSPTNVPGGRGHVRKYGFDEREQEREREREREGVWESPLQVHTLYPVVSLSVLGVNGNTRVNGLRLWLRSDGGGGASSLKSPNTGLIMTQSHKGGNSANTSWIQKTLIR